MSREVLDDIRQQVRIRANARCEYCLISEAHSFLAFHVDHIIPKKHGGSNQLTNLAWACPQCNYAKGLISEHGWKENQKSFDSLTQEKIPGRIILDWTRGKLLA